METPQERLKSWVKFTFGTHIKGAVFLGLKSSKALEYYFNSKSLLPEDLQNKLISEKGLNKEWYLYGTGEMLTAKNLNSNADVIDGVNIDLIDIEKLTIEQIKNLHTKIQPYIDAFNETNLKKYREHETK